MEQKYIVDFKIVSKTDSRIYVNGSWDFTDYDADTDDGDWEYEQNDGTFAGHLPSYWKVDGVNLSFEFAVFVEDTIRWDIIREELLKNAFESVILKYDEYCLFINS